MNDKLDRLLDHLETFLPKPLTDEQWKSRLHLGGVVEIASLGVLGFYNQ
jgi:hypothetical protein